MAGKEPKESPEAQRAFFDIVNHDLRGPLSAALGYLDILQTGASGPLTDKQKSQLDTVRASMAQLARMIDDSVDLARLSTGAMDFESDPVDLSEMVSDLRELFEFQAQRKGIQFKVELPEELPVLQADGPQIRRVLVALLSNAFKYTPRGSVKLSVSVESGGVKVAVSDTGLGVPKEKAGRLFEKFFKVEETRKYDNPKGLGLGLALCKGIVEAHGGTITAKTEWEKGSEFSFTLPVKAAYRRPSPSAPRKR